MNIVYILFLGMLISLPCRAAVPPAPLEASVAAPTALGELATPSTIVIDVFGTARFEDVAFLQRNLLRVDGASPFAVRGTGDNYVRLEGSTHGQVDDFLDDLTGLAQDRFEMEVARGERVVTVTLRKLTRP
jgi:hypothetical protein